MYKKFLRTFLLIGCLALAFGPSSECYSAALDDSLEAKEVRVAVYKKNLHVISVKDLHMVGGDRRAAFWVHCEKCGKGANNVRSVLSIIPGPWEFPMFDCEYNRTKKEQIQSLIEEMEIQRQIKLIKKK